MKILEGMAITMSGVVFLVAGVVAGDPWSALVVVGVPLIVAGGYMAGAS